MNVGKQIGIQDCALFAIAYLTSLAFNEDPTEIIYDQEEMRQHLIDCFNKKVIVTFPVKNQRRVKNKVKKLDTIDIFCYFRCRLPDNGDKMICCDKCNKWYHFQCIKENVHLNSMWTCNDCI